MKSTEEEGLDNIFKQGLQEPGHFAEYRESDWDALEQMLDEKERKRPIILWLRIASGIAAMMLLGFGWLYMQKANDGLKPLKQPVAIHTDTKGNSSNGVNTPVATQTSPAAQTNIIAAATHKDNAGTSGGNEHQKAVGSNNTSSVRRTHILAMDRHYPKDNSFLSLSGPATRRDDAGLVDNGAINRGNPEVLAAVSGTKIDAFGANNATDIPQLKNDEAVNVANDFKDMIKGVRVDKRRPQFAITVLASPNVNGVGSFSQAQVGSNLGLIFSMGVSKFTFSTGAVYAKTPYAANASSYTIAYPSKYTPDNISADCRVLDIPLNVDYQVYNKANNAFSIGSGLSSYIMLNENYHYNYNSPYAGYYPQGFSVTNQNRYFFGVLNLDATYQRKLNANFSFDVQPYLKIPLTGIGAGDVKLQTMGVALGLKWNLNRLFKP
jgi:hypothetical protein